MAAIATITPRQRHVALTKRPRSISSGIYQTVEWLMDPTIFNSILDLDDNDGYSFARPLIHEYFSMARSASKDMTRDL